MPTPYKLRLRFIQHPESGGGESSAVSVLEELSLCFSSQGRYQFLVDEVLRNPHKVDVLAWLKAFPCSWSPALRDLVGGSFPFSREQARLVRDYLETQSAEIQASVAAYIQLGNQFKLFPYLDGNKIRSFYRKSWAHLGFKRHPMPFVATCPQCGNPAPCKLTFSSKHALLAASDMTCEHCGYHENIDFERAWCTSAHHKAPSLAAAADEFLAIEKAQSEWWASSARDHLLPYLQRWLSNLEASLRLEAGSLPADLERMRKEPYGRSDLTGWHIRLYGGGTFELSSNLLEGYVSPAFIGHARYASVSRAMDELLDKVPARFFSAFPNAVPDVVMHWRGRFNEQCALLADALAARDLSRSAAAAAAIAYSINEFGLISDIEFELESPSVDIRLKAKLVEVKRSIASGSSAGSRSATLADFLSSGLASYGVPPGAVSALLERYWAR